MTEAEFLELGVIQESVLTPELALFQVMADAGVLRQLEALLQEPQLREVLP